MPLATPVASATCGVTASLRQWEPARTRTQSFPDSMIVNEAPQTSDTNADTMAYVPVSGQLSGSDADGDKILFSSVGSTVRQGTLQLQPNGQWSYSPAPGFVGQSSFLFRAADAYGGVSSMHTLAITVVTNPADSDNDGLPDAYEQSQLGGLGADPLGDADLDGQSNYFEYLAGTSPADAAQNLSTTPSVTAGASVGGNFKIDLNHVRPGVSYHLESSADLDALEPHRHLHLQRRWQRHHRRPHPAHRPAPVLPHQPRNKRPAAIN